MQPILAVSAPALSQPPLPEAGEEGVDFDLVLGPMIPDVALPDRVILSVDTAPVQAALPLLVSEARTAIPLMPPPAAVLPGVEAPAGPGGAVVNVPDAEDMAAALPSKDKAALPDTEVVTPDNAKPPQTLREAPERPEPAVPRPPGASSTLTPGAPPEVRAELPAAMASGRTDATRPRADEPARTPVQKPAARGSERQSAPLQPSPDPAGIAPKGVSPPDRRSVVPPVPAGSDVAGDQTGRDPARTDLGPAVLPRPADPPVAFPLSPPAAPPPPSPTQASQPAASVPVPLSQLPEAVVSALATGEGIAIDLAPADLGRLRIELPATAGAVDVRLVVERAETLALVQKAAETLADDLRQAGILAQSVTVELLAADRGDATRPDTARADPGGSGLASAAGSGTASHDRSSAAASDGGSEPYRGSGGGPDRDAPPGPLPEREAGTSADRLYLRL